MATRRGTTARFEGPCLTCEHRPTCEPYRELSQYLFARREFQRDPTPLAMDSALDEVVAAYVQSLRTLEAEGRFDRADLGIALAALVDFCITGVYTNGLISDQAEFRQNALTCGGNRAIFPYTWMCPLCVSDGRTNPEAYLPGAERETDKGITRDYPQVRWLAKPGGRAIGDQGIQVVKALLRATLSASRMNARLRDGGGARGEFDLTIATDTTIAFIEVKAKPMLAFPLLAEIDRQESPHGTHAWGAVQMAEVQRLYLFLGAINDKVTITTPTPGETTVWPLNDLAQVALQPDAVEKVFMNWKAQCEAYFTPAEPFHLRWHRFGCGNFAHVEPGGLRVEKRVANTKELPGLDRTDDIKKGAAQVLKYSRLKFECGRRALRSVLLGNTHALSHHEDYVEPIINLKVLADGADPNRAEWIFDAMVGLTKNTFNDPGLANLFAFERLLDQPLDFGPGEITEGGPLPVTDVEAAEPVAPQAPA